MGPRRRKTPPSVVVVAVLLMEAVVSAAAQGDHVESGRHHHHDVQHASEERHRLRHSTGVPCTMCPPGWGLLSPCTRSSDTTCALCPIGSYSPHHSASARCWLCSRCGAGLFESHPCTPRSDTKCDSCLTARPRPLGVDFDRKCLFGRISPVVEEGRGGGGGGARKGASRVERRTYAFFRLSGERRPGGGWGGDGGRTRWRALNNGSSSEEEEEEVGRDNSSTTLTLGVISIATFQFAVCVAAAAAVCQLARRTHSCLADERKDRTPPQEFNPLMEVAVSH